MAAALATVAGGALALPPAAGAAVMSFGSPLAAPATVAETHPVDTAFWATALSGGAPVGAPADGQVTAVRVKGTAQPSGQPGAPRPLTQVHFQVLAPQADGSVVVAVTSQGFDLPVSAEVGGDTNHVSTFAPTNFCVHRGDLIDLNDEGGFDATFFPSGVPFQVFGSVAGSTTAQFSKGDGTVNGSRFSGSPKSGEELLMQMTLATGPDASALCPGGTRGAAPGRTPRRLAPVRVSRQTAAVNRRRVTRPAIFCAGPGRCRIALTLSAAGPGGSRLGAARASLRPQRTTHVPIRLSRAGVRQIKAHHKRLTAVLEVALGSGAPGSAVSQTITLVA
ncbi:MAG: hypothetical protein E6G56_05465 [Actinobacteria bacterium]|nr:MAG: hypothetical protein E6G56_05465 [Actinomycetota bacterium]